MSHVQELTRRYHEKFHPDTHNTTPEQLSFELLGFRLMLFEEESREALDAHTELCAAIEVNADRTSATAHLLHELADVVFVAYGTAERLGFDLDEIVTALVRSLMSKTRNPDPAGKALKPPGWISPQEVIEAMVQQRAGNVMRAADPFGQPSRPMHPLYGAGVGHRPAPWFGPLVTAQFESGCAECDDEIAPGDPIRVGPDGSVHDECAREVLGELDRA